MPYSCFLPYPLLKEKITVVEEDDKTNSPMADAMIPVRGSKTSAISKEGGNLRLLSLQGKNLSLYLLWGITQKLAESVVLMFY